MDKILLRFVGFFDPVLSKAGVNTVQLHEILRVKLLMDSRRPKATFGARRGNANKKATNPWFANFAVLLMGCFMGIVLFFFKMPLVGQTLYFSIFIVIMALTMISDFTTVLIDTRDQFIISPRPVDDRTFAISRLMHITLYVMRLALLQGLPGLIIIGFVDGVWAVPLFFIQIIEATLLSILLVNMIYFILMRLVSPQKFKDIISYFQIGFSILIFAVYYLVPRLINVSVLKGINLLAHRWAYFLPSVWVASFNEVVLHQSRANLLIWLMAAFGIVLPAIGFWFVAKVLAPGFNRKLTLLATSDGSSNSIANKKRYKTDFRNKIANLLAPDPVENAGFKITWKLAARTREFKMKVFPAFAYVPIYFLYFALNGKGETLAEKYERLQNSNNYIFLIYLTTFVLATILQNVSQSGKYKSAWIYYALPVDKPGKILSGMYKAIIALYFFPYCLVISIIIVFVWGPSSINDIILAFLVSTIYGMLMALFMVKGLPFSRPVVVKGRSKMITSFVIVALIGVVGFGHHYLMQWERVIWVLLIPALLLNWLMFSQYKKQTWDNIEAVDM
jgi:ABC-2 type transport system permease protein